MCASNSTGAWLGWVSSPDGRGTMDIIWGCLLTIFLCVWTVLTLNVPPPDTTLWRFTCLKIKWAVIALFGPEWLTAMAGAQWSIARISVARFKKGKVEWTMRQAFFADMGGVRVKLRNDEFPVTSNHIYALFKRDLIKLDAITPAAIKDRSKADGLAKLFTILQTGWFILQCLARLIQKIGITTLELSTIAFVACTIGTNIMWWYKPKDVSVPIILDIDYTLEELLAKFQPEIPDAKLEVRNWEWSPLERIDNLRPNFLADVALPLPWMSHDPPCQQQQKIRFRNDRLPPIQRDWLLNLFLLLVSLIFGAIYVAAWNISFPTCTERLVWRICSIMLFSLVVAYWSVDVGVELHQRRKKRLGIEKKAVTPVMIALFAVIATIYVTIRIYILIEPFVSLRKLPANAFETIDWVSIIPHF